MARRIVTKPEAIPRVNGVNPEVRSQVRDAGMSRGFNKKMNPACFQFWMPEEHQGVRMAEVLQENGWRIPQELQRHVLLSVGVVCLEVGNGFQAWSAPHAP